MRKRKGCALTILIRGILPLLAVVGLLIMNYNSCDSDLSEIKWMLSVVFWGGVGVLFSVWQHITRGWNE